MKRYRIQEMSIEMNTRKFRDDIRKIINSEKNVKKEILKYLTDKCLLADYDTIDDIYGDYETIEEAKLENNNKMYVTYDPYHGLYRFNAFVIVVEEVNDNGDGEWLDFDDLFDELPDETWEDIKRIMDIGV